MQAGGLCPSGCWRLCPSRPLMSSEGALFQNNGCGKIKTFCFAQSNKTTVFLVSRRSQVRVLARSEFNTFTARREHGLGHCRGWLRLDFFRAVVLAQQNDEDQEHDKQDGEGDDHSDERAGGS